MSNLSESLNSPDTQSSIFDVWMNRFYNYVDNIKPTSRKGYFIGWLLVALALTAASSVYLGQEWAWVNGIIGAPAGIIFWLLGCAILHRRKDKLSENSIWRIRESRSQRQRMRPALVLAAIVVVVLIVSGAWLFQYAMGIGGVIIISVALTVFSMLHRTPEETYLFLKGIPDPRDTLGDDEEYVDDEEYSEDEELESDNEENEQR